MKSIELLWFEDVNPFNEAVFAFPIVGKLSMRQMLVLGLGIITSWGIYQSTANYASLVPMFGCCYLAFKKQKVQSTESYIFAVLCFYLRSKDNIAKKIIGKQILIQKNKSTKLAFAEPYRPKLEKTGKEIQIRQVFSDPLKPIRLKIRIQRTDNKPIANTEAKIVFDGKVVSTLSTDNNGELEAIVIPQTYGEKKLEIYAKGMEVPVYQEMMSIKHG
ncbi:MAG: hypothetical protein QXX85_04310 [Candidatus Nitrosotenuis sp.]